MYNEAVEFIKQLVESPDYRHVIEYQHLLTRGVRMPQFVRVQDSLGNYLRRKEGDILENYFDSGEEIQDIEIRRFHDGVRVALNEHSAHLLLSEFEQMIASWYK